MSSELSVTEHKDILKLDSHGLPLIPQPTSSLLDPLNYPNWLRYMILVELSLLSFLSAFASALLNPAVDQLAREFHVSPQVATYQISVALAVGAISPIILMPFANAYGHRIMLLIVTAVNVAVILVAAESTSFAMLIILQGLAGLGHTDFVLGVAIVPGLCFVHQRGRAMGFYIVSGLSGIHVAPIVGGYVAIRLGWRWTLRLAGILLGSLLIILVFLLPDTLFQRPHQTITLGAQLEMDLDSRRLGQPHKPPPIKLSTFIRFLRLVDRERMPSRNMRLADGIIRPFKMFKYPSVALPVIYYAVVTSFSMFGPLIVAPAQFTELYNFNSLQNGLASGLSVTIGALIGEVFSGPVTDFIIERARKRAIEGGRPAEPEIRLQGLWPAAVIVPGGLLIIHVALFAESERHFLDGFTIRYAHTFVAPCIALAFTCIGGQIVSSVCITYTCSDCYPARSGDLGQCFSFVKYMLTLALTFYEIPMAQQVGYQWAFTIYSIICMLFFSFIIALMVKGAEWREKAVMPTD